ncbi:PfkB family carbohydrate kinase [Paenibacillus marinisediminis]
MNRIVAFGELMLRLSPPAYQRFPGSQSYDVHFGGSEANVATALSRWGLPASYVTKVPADALGDSAVQALRSAGIDTSYIVQGKGRLGIYYLEQGYSIRPSKVIYDRANSAVSLAQVEEFEIDRALEGASLFHVSGITLGISEHARKIAKAFIAAAKRKGIPVSFDVNYRSKLWTLEEARAGMLDILDSVDVLFAGHLDMTNLLRIEPDFEFVTGEEAAYIEHLYRKFMARYPQIQLMACSIREMISSSRNRYQGVLFDGQVLYRSKAYDLDIIDRVGTGDAYAAGVLFAYLTGREFAYAVEYGAAAAAIKHTMPGDALIAAVAEVEDTFNTEGYKIQR